jgi:RNA recognition motif-containing protein
MKNLYVGNMEKSTTETDIRTAFATYGPVEVVTIIKDQTTGLPRGFGFVEMADKFHAYDAIDNLDSIFFEGNIISVKEAKQNNTKSGGSTFGRKPAFNKPSFKPRTFAPRPRPDNKYKDKHNINRL